MMSSNDGKASHNDDDILKSAYTVTLKGYARLKGHDGSHIL